MLRALETQFDVALVVRDPWPSWFTLLRRVVRRLSAGTVDLYWSRLMSKRAASGTLSSIEESGCDVVFAVAITPICAQAVSLKKTVFVSDATHAIMVNYNPHRHRLAATLKRSAEFLESVCIQQSVLSLFPSEWAAESAIRDHGGSPDRVVKIPWGANLLADDVPAPEGRSMAEWRVLFVGVDWKGKGGDIALETVAEMRRQGHPVHIDIVGSAPNRPVRAIEGVTFHGYLDKNGEEDRRRLKEIFAAAHVFFLPTQFDALGIVFAEAASFGLPSISYRTGGIPGMVVDGETGVLLPEGASAAAFATVLTSIFKDRNLYNRMAHAALKRSRETLNWTSWAVAVRQALESRLTP
jgi:glycosyltransferase involved in cell wall biosynthesis